MKTYNVLIVEDKTARAEELREKCQTARFGNCRFEITGDKANAREKLRHWKVDIALVDLDLNPSVNGAGSGKLDGLDVIAQIRDESKQSLIVAYSSEFGPVLDVGTMVPRQRDVYDACIQRHVDLILATAQLLNESAAQLGRRLNALIAGRGGHAAENLIADVSIGTRAAREVLDDDVIREAVTSMLGTEGFFRYKSLGTGFTSAVVLWVENAATRDGVPTATSILKFFRDEDTFLSELAGRPATGTSLDGYSTKIEAPDARDIAGWRVARSRALVGAVDLVSWLAHKRKHERRVFDELVKLALPPSDAYAFSDKHDVDGKLQMSRPINYRFISKVHALVARSREVQGMIPRSLRVDGESVVDFLCAVADEERPLLCQKTKLVPQHGDMHGRNVFVGEHGDLHLIDFGRGMRLPRYFDIATLLVDLWLGQCAATGASEYSWQSGSEIHTRALGTWPFGAPQKGNDRGGVRERLADRLCGAVHTSGGDVVAAEFLEVLGLSLLRYSTFSNIAIVRRLVALKLAEAAFAGVRAIEP